MAIIKAKKIEMSELFYDLVFVFAISKVTALIHHLHDGILTPQVFITFLLAFIILINTWMVETVYTNRYGKNSVVDISFMFLQMIFLLIAANSITSEWQTTFKTFLLSFGSISFILMLQYIYQFILSKNKIDKDITRPFIFILAFRSFMLFVSVTLPLTLATITASLGIIISWFLPSTITKRMQKNAINFAHLAERISLLVIITFGEMIIGISSYFTQENFSITALLIFAIVINLFIFYILKFEHVINHHLTNESGTKMIYTHYLIFFGLSIITVSLSFIEDTHAKKLFALLFLFSGLLLFYLGILLLKYYNKDYQKYTKKLFFQLTSIFLIGILCSLIFLNSSFLLFIITTLTFLILLVYLNFIFKNKNSKNNS